MDAGEASSGASEAEGEGAGAMAVDEQERQQGSLTPRVPPPPVEEVAGGEDDESEGGEDDAGDRAAAHAHLGLARLAEAESESGSDVVVRAAAHLEAAVATLLDELRPDVCALVDAFDRTNNSVL